VTQLVRIDSLPDAARGAVISIGNFDGVHVGHAALLGKVCNLASTLRAPSAAVILDPHPASLLRPEANPERLTTLDRRLQRLSAIGIDYLIVCPIDREFLRLSADAFFQQLIVDRLLTRGIVEGVNFCFGRHRAGDIHYLRRLCESAAIELIVADSTQFGDWIVSSTRIRDLLRQGNVATAAQLLGAPYRLAGVVGQGEKRGRTLGFPTANLEQISTMIPAPGVYAAVAHIGQIEHPAAIHVGSNPTFKQHDSKVEVHVLDFWGDLYGSVLQVDFLTQVRDIARFDSSEDLVRQLSTDIQQIRELVRARSE
jgi:riboflavin kinase/FMN adenylyltransferase